MNLFDTSRRPSHLVSLGTLLLVVAVFAWGVQYKTSLYKPASKTSPHIKEVKFLSNKERPSLSHAELAFASIAQRILTVVFACLVGAMLVGLDPLRSAYAKGNVRDTEQLPKQPSQSFFFFRPPPVILPSQIPVRSLSA